MICCGLKILKECMKKSADDTNLIVKYGKPIMVVKYGSILKIALMTVAVTVFCTVYCIGIFHAAVRTKLNIGVYINMVSSQNDGDVLPTLFALPGLICLLMNAGALYLLFKCFQSSKNVWLNRIMYAYVLVCLLSVLVILIFCITILTHVYGEHKKLHDGIVDAMLNYSTNSKVKQDIDVMQIEFQCCGSKSYDEWYKIQWYDSNLVKSSQVENAQTPFSCCSMSSMFPCVHQQIESTGTIYLYRPETNLSISRSGCYHMIKERKQEVAWKIIGRLVVLMALMVSLTIGLRFLQTAHFERYQLTDIHKSYTIWLIGCYQGKKQKSKSPPPVPPVPPELKGLLIE